MKKQGYTYFEANPLVMEAHDRSKRGALNEERNRRLRERYIQVLNLAIISTLCFFIGRTFIFKDIAPFGTALFAAMLYRRQGSLIGFAAILGGMLSVHVGGYIFKYLGAMGLVFLTLNIFDMIRLGRKKFLLAAITAIAVFSANLIYRSLSPGGILLYDYILASLEGAITLALVYVFENVLSVILDVNKRRILSNEEMISIGLFAALLIAGIWDIRFISMSLRNILSVFFIILAAHIGGVGVGAAMGILMGLVLTMATGPDPLLIAGLGVCGLMAGTFRELGKSFTGLTFLLSNAFMAFYVSGSSITILSFREILVSTGLLMAIPNRFLDLLRQFVDYSLMRYKEQKYYINRMQELTVGRLSEFSKVFKELSAAFGQISNSALRGQDDIARLLDIISDQVCSACPLYGSCWERNFTRTYNGMFDIIDTIESMGTLEGINLRSDLYKGCIHGDRLISSIERVYGLYKSNLKWKARIDECRQLVAQQLDGVSGVVGQLARELNMKISFNKDLEETISIELDKAGIRAREVLVMEKPGGSVEVNIHKKSCNGRRECTRKVESIVSRALGRRMTANQSTCTAMGREECVLRLLEAEEFQVSTGVARKPGKSGEVSGDSYSFNALAHGKYMLALSDGMGIGHKAREESQVAISLLENFLEAGFDLKTTIRSINSTLLLRSQDEIFATADLCLLDLVSGKADFVKIGAVPTYIKRNDRVEVVKASSLPIGILDSIQPETTTLKLQDEDMIIMITDGVLDNSSMGDRAEEWLIGIIGSLETKNPQEMADHILESVLKADNRVIPLMPDQGSRNGKSHTVPISQDDMTVMATRVWRSIF
jgi:stage II sporulation protein E